MKKKVTLSLIGITSVALLSFKPGSGNTEINTSVITCNDGTVIIPSGVNMTAADQIAMLNIMNTYGSNAGYLVYSTQNGTQVYNAPTESGVLSQADGAMGTDLQSGGAGTGWAIYKETICLTMAKQILYKTSTITMALHDDLEPILTKYGYVE
jgi:hypothetical protein